METVAIGCRLPNGVTLEVGLQTTARGDRGGLITQVKRTDKYERYTLRGTHQHTVEMRRRKILMPAIRNPEPYINRNVPKHVWEQWLKDHPKSWLVTSGQLFEVKDAAKPENVSAAVVDAMAKPGILQPIDPTKPMKFSDGTVTKAEFDDDKK